MQRNFRGMGILSISIFIGMLILMGMAMDLFAHNYEESGRNQKYMQEITFSDKNTLHNGSNTGYSTNYSGYSATSSYGSSSDKNNVPSTKPSGISTGAAYTGSSYYYGSYDDGYNDVYENDDFDWDRYLEDDDYAEGVDDAMEDLDW